LKLFNRRRQREAGNKKTKIIVTGQGWIYQATWMFKIISVRDKVVARDVLGTTKY
jgi:hypothetical protein